MCGRYTVTTVDEIWQRFEVPSADEWDERRLPPVMPRWNVAPSQAIPTVVTRDGRRRLEPMIWGFHPAWMDDSRRIPPPINAKAETLLEKGMWKGALLRNRCVIPADGFYEWRSVPGRKAKQPMYVRRKDGGLFGFAGLWVRDADGNGTCAIITTAPNQLMLPIHNRMPAILLPEDEAVWLDPDEAKPTALLGCVQPYPEGELEAIAVSPLVSNVRNEGPELVEPLASEDTGSEGRGSGGQTGAPAG